MIALRFFLCLFAFQTIEMSNVEYTLNTGLKIPQIGLGTYLIRGENLTNKVIDEALGSGYRLFDTAQNYRNEHDLGAAFKKLLPKHGLKREDIFITSKFEPSVNYKTEEDYLKLVRTALKNLQTDYLDLMLIHWPGVIGVPNNSEEVIKYRHNAWKALSKFYKQGLIRNIGVSNFLVRHLAALQNSSDVVPVINQVEWHPKYYDLKLLKYCKDNNILLQAYSSLGTSGSLSLRNNETVKKIAQKLGKSPSQILLRWALLRDIAVIPKASSRAHLEENMDLNFSIPKEDFELLDSLKSGERFDENASDIV